MSIINISMNVISVTNPCSGRKIKVGGPTWKALMKGGDQNLKASLIEAKRIAEGSQNMRQVQQIQETPMCTVPYCKGNGICINVCSDTRCSCRETEAAGFHLTGSCTLVRCINHECCKRMMPRYRMTCNGLDTYCEFRMKYFKTTDIIDTCPVCLETEKMIALKCNHNICIMCWGKMRFINTSAKCPICRNISR